ncbi:hypothetical protein [Streptomyces sp. NPDC003023]|uniref:hypothetical protein n=1 Tax=Streptomyces sp. NPDC003023 TaxID=3364675 RepID=UPI0036789417
MLGIVSGRRRMGKTYLLREPLRQEAVRRGDVLLVGFDEQYGSSPRAGQGTGAKDA